MVATLDSLLGRVTGILSMEIKATEIRISMKEVWGFHPSPSQEDITHGPNNIAEIQGSPIYPEGMKSTNIGDDVHVDSPLPFESPGKKKNGGAVRKKACLRDKQVNVDSTVFQDIYF
ncbi:hypothetical protein NDU88_005932 [Pleurodeles waltl]|uniref:Uncharacterized protein n=1 Tax=Pleurodeles waltl TaxID=8319 RepID=A0AAV7NNS3_PLEWA|nr:hypothetical protein NDU88_005932 [Pleurodeles waltl]